VEVFKLPRLANSVGEVTVNSPFVVDDQGRLYGNRGDYQTLTVLGLDGREIYSDPANSLADRRTTDVILHPTQPNVLLARMLRKWYVIQFVPPDK
jgi:hypothetical protein